MIKNKRIGLVICLIAIFFASILGGTMLYQHITEQRELDNTMEQEQRLSQLYITLNRNRPILSSDPMEIPHVIIGLAGLRSIGFSREEVEEIWTSSENVHARNSPNNHPEFKTVHDFIIEGGARDFGNALNRVYYANFETISIQFPQFELVISDDSTSLPLSVVKELIDLYEAENPPQSRPVVETESEP